jgi:hypothetical protein
MCELHSRWVQLILVDELTQGWIEPSPFVSPSKSEAESVVRTKVGKSVSFVFCRLSCVRLELKLEKAFLRFERVLPSRPSNVRVSSCLKNRKRTTPGIPTWSPTVVLTEPEHA